MVFHLLPEHLCGFDTDEICAYTTPKMAWVRDRYVGACYYLLICMALCWVFIGQLLWRNEHFQLMDVQGIPRMLASHPTLNQCDPNLPDCLPDFTALSKLPYCTQSADKVKHPAKCIFGDKHTIFPKGEIGDVMFIPTSQVQFTEKKHCEPSAENNWSCDAEYRMDWTGKKPYYSETEMEFFANIEDVTVQFTSSYQRGDIAGTSLLHPGFYDECMDPLSEKDMKWEERLDERRHHCEDLKREQLDCLPHIPCQKLGTEKMTAEDMQDSSFLINSYQGRSEHWKASDATFAPSDEFGQTFSRQQNVWSHHSRGGSFTEFYSQSGAGQTTLSFGENRLSRMRGQLGRTAARTKKEKRSEDPEHLPTPDAFSTAWGDSFKVGKLLKLARVDLDRQYNLDNQTLRMAGTIIQVEVIYENLRHFLSSFGMSEVRYHYHVTERKLPYVNREFLNIAQPNDYPATRKYMLQHGIFLSFSVAGQFGFFSIVYTLIMLTTAMTLLATAHKVTDLYSIYGHSRKKNYFHLKYEVSPDFSDMWKCGKCGYYNMDKDETCQGREQWVGHEVEVCGASKSGAVAPPEE